MLASVSTLSSFGRPRTAPRSMVGDTAVSSTTTSRLNFAGVAQ
jgi:hypothetical protein